MKTASQKKPKGWMDGRVTARRSVAETSLALAAPRAVVFERAHTNAPGETVPMRSSSLRATAAWATAEAGTVRLGCEPTGAFAAVAGGIKTPLPCEWASARDAADSREIALEGGAALAEAGDAAKITLTFTPDGGGATIEESAEIRAYELRVEAVSDWPTNKVRHVFGPLEEVKLSITPDSSSVDWHIEGTTGEGKDFPWTAYFKPTSDEGRVTVDGATLGFTLETVAPQRLKAGGFRAAEDWDYHREGFGVPEEGKIGVGLIVTNIVVTPDWVSFTNVSIKEGCCTATNMWGIFNFPGAVDILPPHGADAGAEEVMSVGEGNSVGDDFAAIAFEEIVQPWRSGGFQYDIPLYWCAKDDSHEDEWIWFGTESQVFTFGTNGDLTVGKFGGAVTRGTNGISRIRKESAR